MELHLKDVLAILAVLLFVWLCYMQTIPDKQRDICDYPDDVDDQEDKADWEKDIDDNDHIQKGFV